MSIIPIPEINTKLNRGTPFPMGVTLTKKGINFSVSVPKNKSCSILFYKKQEQLPFGKILIPEEFRIGNVFAILLESEFQNYDYNFETNGKIFTDPYAKHIVGRETWGIYRKKEEIKCRINKCAFDWKGDKQLQIPYHECILYGLHPRGYTKHSSSKVSKKGTFQGITEKIPYLKKIGINVVELMPAYEFDEIVREEVPLYMSYSVKNEEIKYKINYWGYGKGDYFSPKSSYASSQNPIDEFKNLVKEMHKNGIEIIMQMFFDEKTNPNLILECLRYWYMEYHIDGFHVFGSSVPEQVILNDPLLSNAKLILPYINSRIYQEECEPQFRNVAECNNEFLEVARKFLKSDEDQLEKFTYRARRNPKEKAMINYITNHNGFTLMDLVSYDEKHNEANDENNKDGNDYNLSWNCGVEGVTKKKAIKKLRLMQRKNAILLLILSQGVPFLLAGDEIGNSQKGNNNAYCQDNEIGWINWKGEESEQQIFQFIQKVIAFRRRHPVFHLAEELKIMDYKSCGYPDISYHGINAWYPDMAYNKRQLGIMYCGKYAKKNDGSDDNFFYVAYNLYWEEKEFDLPNLPNRMKWYIAIDSSVEKEEGVYKEGEEPILEQQKSLKVSSRTIVVLIGK